MLCLSAFCLQKCFCFFIIIKLLGSVGGCKGSVWLINLGSLQNKFDCGFDFYIHFISSAHLYLCQITQCVCSVCSCACLSCIWHTCSTYCIHMYACGFVGAGS